MFSDDFLVNIFLVFCPLFFLPYLLKIQHNAKIYKLILFLLFAFALAGTMHFPQTVNGLTSDYRLVPLVTGSIYGGNLITVLLYLTLLTVRFLLSAPNQMMYVIAIAPTILVFFSIAKKYHSFTLFQKIAASILISAFVRIYILISYLYFTHNLKALFSNASDTILGILFQCVIIGFWIFLFENIKKSFYLQKEIVKSEKMKIVSDIAASVAHEIRNPLTAIRGFIQLLGSSPLSDEKREAYMKICLEELNRAQLIISDYLSLAKPDPEKIEPIEIRSEFTYITNLLRSYANYQNVQVDCSVADDKKISILGDKFKFRQALINIGKNAIEAMPNGGILKFEAFEHKANIFICVIDNGTGMSQDQVNRLGTPYYSTKDKGTGLGTMISFNILKNMHGKIEIESEIGKGTKYTIVFPVMPS